MKVKEEENQNQEIGLPKKIKKEIIEMKTFWNLMEKSTITSAVLAVMLGGTVCYCAVSQIGVPDYLIATFSVVITFFFTSKLKDESAAAQSVK